MAKQQFSERSGGNAPVAAAPDKPRKPPREKVVRDANMPLGPGLRFALSVVILFHLAAVFIPPWYLYVATPSKATPALPPGDTPRDASGRTIPREQWNEQNAPLQRAPLLDSLGWVVRHYANLLYINNGYEFFSPNPMAGHVIDYEVFDKAGQSLAKGRLPDLRDQRPRLFYHRHMMMVEQTLLPDSDLPRSHVYVADRLMREHGGASIRMTLSVHRLLTPQQVLDGRRPDEQDLFEVVDSFVHRDGDLPRPGGATESIPSPETRIPGVN